jgi:hypothetical protein
MKYYMNASVRGRDIYLRMYPSPIYSKLEETTALKSTFSDIGKVLAKPFWRSFSGSLSVISPPRKKYWWQENNGVTWARRARWACAR